MRKKKKKKKPRIKRNLLVNIRKANPFILARIFILWILFSPWFLLTLLLSYFKMRRWQNPNTCQNFIKRYSLAFEHIHADSVTVESRAGGVNNFNQLWHCKTLDGRKITYFVKVFMHLGSFWAKNLSLVSPFPAIYGASTQERFSTDTVSRVQLADLGLNVPKLVAFDPVEQVIVMEYIEGVTVDEVLEKVAGEKSMTDKYAEMIRQCAVGLAQMHRAGFSLIDTQPVNCIWVETQKKVYFTDLEFCTREDKRAWDAGFFLCFLAIRLPEKFKAKARMYFLGSYQTERGLNLEALEETVQSMREYLPVFETILDIRQFTPEELFTALMSEDSENKP